MVCVSFPLSSDPGYAPGKGGGLGERRGMGGEREGDKGAKEAGELKEGSRKGQMLDLKVKE